MNQKQKNRNHLMNQNSPIIWQGHTPISTLFDDVYFSPKDGLAETEHVFLHQSNLYERFLNQEKRFVITETGFGTGLNFLSTWKLWHSIQKNQQILPDKNPLIFISCEKYPLLLPDMEKSLQNWKDIHPYMEILLEAWPGRRGKGRGELGKGPIPKGSISIEQAREVWQAPEAGWHIFKFPHVELRLYVGDVLGMFAGIDQRVDAWFLDGFAPVKNPEMWQPEMFGLMGGLSHEGTTVATFTAAKHVREGLKKNGFNVQKTNGFRYKRDMTVGHWCAKVQDV